MFATSRIAPAALLGGALGIMGCGPGAGVPDPALEAVRAAAERYRDVSAALADGYVPDPLETCETAAHLGEPAEAGAIGLHYLHPQRLGIAPDETRLDVTATHTDFLRPGALVYEPGPAGALELVAVANMVNAAAWERAGRRRPPTFHGEPYDFVAADPGKMIPAHYDRYVWLLRDNPSGVFSRYNPAVTCEHHIRVMPMEHPPTDGMDHRH